MLSAPTHCANELRLGMFKVFLLSQDLLSMPLYFLCLCVPAYLLFSSFILFFFISF